MKIAIDARVVEKEMTGIGRYLFDILNNIKNIDKKNEYVLFSTVPLSNYNKNHFQNIVLDKYRMNNKLYSPLWLNFILKEYINKNKFDLFFSPNNLCPTGDPIKIKNVITIHDVMFQIDKKYYSFYYRSYLKYLIKPSINKADKIITISECSKRDIIKYYEVKERKIEVIYRTADLKFRQRSFSEFNYQRIKEKYNLPSTYILYVGVIDLRKNIYTILKIAETIRTKYNNVFFVMVGKPHFGFNKISQEIEKIKNVIYLKYVEDADLPYIYNMAKIFLVTSYYEGFGLPVLEAMQSGIPVVTSNSSSFPEVVGDNGFMNSPDDVDGFVKNIQILLNDGKLYKKYCEKSIRGAERFDMTNTIKKHLEVFNQFSPNS